MFLSDSLYRAWSIMGYLGLVLFGSGEHEDDNDKAHAYYDPAYNSRSNKSTYKGWQISIFHFFPSLLTLLRRAE